MYRFSEKIIVETDNVHGWHLKATNAIEPGERILEEHPLFVTPHWDCERMKCANCQKESFVMCKKCNFFPLCFDCQTHDDFECKFMSNATSVKSSDTGSGNGTDHGTTTPITQEISQDLLVKNYAIYGVLKLLLLMENERTRSQCEGFFATDIYLSDEYRLSEMWQEHETLVVAPLLASGILTLFPAIIQRRHAEIDNDFLHKLCFHIDANGFEVATRNSEESLKAIYTQGTKIPHNCIPNTVISFDDQFKMRIYAALPIQRGQKIYNSYVNPLMGTSQRQLQLRLSRQLTCRCARCLDPTEVGTHMSSLKCQHCTVGLMLCYPPYANGTWKCNKCSACMETEEVNNLITDIAEAMANSNNELEVYEQLLTAYESRFHPNHFIIIDIKQNIASILGGLLMNPYAEAQRSVMERKVQICDEVLPLIRAVQPGISKLYTIALYDYLLAYIELMEFKYNKKETTATEYRLELQRADEMANEVVTMLSYEPRNSAEGSLAQRILLEKKQIEEHLKVTIEAEAN